MICLTRAELQELTGYRRPSSVLKNLNDNGIPIVAIGGDGWPRVLQTFVKITPRTLTNSEPNIAALKDMQNGPRSNKAKRPS